MSKVVLLLAALGSDAGLQAEYSAQPEVVMDRYQLTESEKVALSSRDADQINMSVNKGEIIMYDSVIQTYK